MVTRTSGPNYMKLWSIRCPLCGESAIREFDDLSEWACYGGAIRHFYECPQEHQWERADENTEARCPVCGERALWVVDDGLTADLFCPNGHHWEYNVFGGNE